MPELPEVEVCRRALDTFLAGRTITSFRLSEIWAEQLLRSGNPLPTLVSTDGGEGASRSKPNRLVGARITTVQRHGKFYWFELDSDTDVGQQDPAQRGILLGHLRMTGGWWLRRKGTDWPDDDRFPEPFPDRYCHAFIGLDDGSEAVYRDVRRFGTLELMTHADLKLKHQNDWGLDPLQSNWRFASFLKLVEKSRANLKSLLLNQSRIAGLGNIYACEVMHLAGIDPTRSAETLTPAEWKLLFSVIGPLLRRSAEVGGTRLTNLDDLTYIHEPQLYLDNFEVQLRVYGRSSERCLRRGCKGRIERIVQQQRSTFYCLLCQH